MTDDKHEGRVAFAGRAVVAALLAAAAAVHIPVIAHYLGAATWAAVVFGIVAVVALLLATVLLVVDRPGLLLAAAAMGGLAMATYIVTWIVVVPQLSDGASGWTAVWGIATLVLDSLTVRAAVFTLRRNARPKPS